MSGSSVPSVESATKGSTSTVSAGLVVADADADADVVSVVV